MPLRIDLHVHSRRSPDSRIDLERAVEQVGFAGISGFALTDHNTIAGHGDLRAIAARFTTYRFLAGVEVSTREGHLLVYGVRELPPVHAPIVETLDWVRSHGGVSILAHPFRWAHGVGRAIAERAGADGLEAINGHNGAVTNARAELLVARRALSATGGSDAHDLRDIGRGFTEFPTGCESEEEILKALRDHRTNAGGRSLGIAERMRLSVRTGALRALRGFRPI